MNIEEGIEAAKRKNLERVRRWRAAGGKEDPAKVRARVRRWREAGGKEDPEKVDARIRRCRAKKAGAKIVDRDISYRVVYERDNGICYLCGEAVRKDGTLDHVRPLSRGGEHSFANVKLAHRFCNMRKWIKIVT